MSVMLGLLRLAVVLSSCFAGGGALAADRASSSKQATVERPEEALAADSVSLREAVDDADATAAFRRDGATKLSGVLDKAACARLRERIVQEYELSATEEPQDERYTSRSRVRYGDALRVGFAGKRSDVLLPLDDTAVANAVRGVAKRLEAVLRGGVEFVSGEEQCSSADVELVECGSLVAMPGAGHQSLHSDYSASDEGAGLAARVVVFVALEDVPEVDCGATIFKTRGSGPCSSTPLKVGDAVIYDASLPHFGAAKRIGEAPRAVFYSAWARAETAREDLDVAAQLKLPERIRSDFEPVPPPTLQGLLRRDAFEELADTGVLSFLRHGAVAALPDYFGGLGVFAKRRLAPGTELARVPFDRCVFATTAADLVGGEASEFLEAEGHSIESQGVIVAAAIAKLRHDQNLASPWRCHVDSLPWGDGDDSLSQHPLVLASRGMAVEEDDLAAALASAERGVERMRSLLPDVPDATLFRALILVLTRALDLSHIKKGAKIVLMPGGDLFNHPSAKHVQGTRFTEVPISGAAVQSALAESGEAVSIRSPSELELEEGDQIYNWYGNAGWGSGSPQAWKKADRKFLHQYGFEPW